MYQGLHHDETPISGTVKRLDQNTTGQVGKRRRGPTTVGTIKGFFEDLTPGAGVTADQRGRNEVVTGRWYADRSYDLPVLRGDILEFTDPATAQLRVFVVRNRRGPFDITDDEDHFELDLGSEQT